MRASLSNGDGEDLGTGSDLYAPTPYEVAAGWLHGQVRAAVVSGPHEGEPAAILRDALCEYILAGPCLVPFSGGRDSSLVLAVACSVAREAGVELPTALTFRYPGQPQADETRWQEMVMAHLAELGLRPSWRIRDVTDELDVVGPLITPLLLESGHPLWPPALGAPIAVAQEAAGATVLSGEHGDAVLAFRRATLLMGAVRRRGRGLHRPEWEAVAQAALPRSVLAVNTRLAGWAPPWLTPRGRARWKRLAATDALCDPLRWDRSIRRATSGRSVVVANASIERLSLRWGSHVVTPLADARVIGALARHGGRRGLAHRGALTRLLGGDLLPDELYGRRTKATFTASRFHRHTEATVKRWSGEGADPQWVDVPALKAAWSAGDLHPQMAGLVQAAWLTRQGGGQ
jgi:hypothetical protein